MKVTCDGCSKELDTFPYIIPGHTEFEGWTVCEECSDAWHERYDKALKLGAEQLGITLQQLYEPIRKQSEDL